MTQPLTLIGDTIENPWNALVMLHAAEMLGSACLFRDRKGLDAAWKQTLAREDAFPGITVAALQANYTALVACDTFDHAGDIYDFRLTNPGAAALIVGNERLGVSRDIGAIAHYAVRIPMISRHIRCLNVAAAAAVGLYYLGRNGKQRQRIRSSPAKKRPDLCLMGAGDQIELGSSIRSACAFGWERALIEDRCNVWFGCDRAIRSEGRGAARRGHNPIRLIPMTHQTCLSYKDVVVINTQGRGKSLHRSNLAHGADQLIVIPDESQTQIDAEDWERFGQQVEFAYLDLPARTFIYHYRLITTIAMAEIACQVGQKPSKPGRERGARKPVYDKALRTVVEEQGELLFLEDLLEY